MKAELVMLAQTAADNLRRGTGASYTVVILVDEGEMYVGAQVPRLAVLVELLEQALEQSKSPDGTVFDLRKS